ncbi:MAG: hypothetical protein ACK4PI_06880 [Tepidisphaerales bacterium]
MRRRDVSFTVALSVSLVAHGMLGYAVIDAYAEREAWRLASFDRPMWVAGEGESLLPVALWMAPSSADDAGSWHSETNDALAEPPSALAALRGRPEPVVPPPPPEPPSPLPVPEPPPRFRPPMGDDRGGGNAIGRLEGEQPQQARQADQDQPAVSREEMRVAGVADRPPGSDAASSGQPGATGVPGGSDGALAGGPSREPGDAASKTPPGHGETGGAEGWLKSGTALAETQREDPSAEPARTPSAPPLLGASTGSPALDVPRVRRDQPADAARPSPETLRPDPSPPERRPPEPPVPEVAAPETPPRDREAGPALVTPGGETVPPPERSMPEGPPSDGRAGASNPGVGLPPAVAPSSPPATAPPRAPAPVRPPGADGAPVAEGSAAPEAREDGEPGGTAAERIEQRDAAPPLAPGRKLSESGAPPSEAESAGGTGGAGAASQGGGAGGRGSGGAAAGAGAVGGAGADVTTPPRARSDRDADPFSRIGSISFSPGRVDARLGRQVRWVRPRLTLAGQIDAATSRTAAVGMAVSIDATGRVVNVRVLESSGFPDTIDLPVVRAVYSWWFEPLKDASGTPQPDVVLIRVVIRG